MNNTGYQNLLKLISLAHLEGFYYHPRIDREILTQYNEGLICLTACIKGEIPNSILKGDDATRPQEYRLLPRAFRRPAVLRAAGQRARRTEDRQRAAH